jgi:hypothetical protein
VVRPNDSFGARRRQPRGWDIHPSSGGHHGPVTSRKDGYRPRLSPRHLIRILAKGQSSTDLIITEAPEASRISVHPSPLAGVRRETTPQVGIVRRPFNHGKAVEQAGIVKTKVLFGLKKGCLHQGSSLKTLRAGRIPAVPTAPVIQRRPPVRERSRSKAGTTTPSSWGRTMGADEPAQLSEEPGNYLLTGLT